MLSQNELFFSVVIPTYNRAPLLERCLNSLCKQTYKNFEVLVCDDGSTDDTMKIIESYKSSLNLLYLWEENWGGPARPRNLGISVAKGEWICFLDSDDWFYPNKLEEVAKHVRNNDCIYHDLDVYDKRGHMIRHLKSRQLKHDITKDLLLNGSLPNSSVCVKTELLKKINGLSEDKNLIAVEDFDCLLRLAEVTSKFKHIPISMGGYHYGDNISVSEKQIERIETVMTKHIHKLSEQDHVQIYKILNYSKALVYHKLFMFKRARSYYLMSLTRYSIARNLIIIIRYLLTLIRVIY